MKKYKTKEFLEELSRFGIKAEYEWGRIVLSELDYDTREHFAGFLKRNPEFEGALIWELAKTNEYIMEAIQERRAIRGAECGDDSVYGAIMCNIPSA